VSAAPRHPSDAERERAAAETVDRYAEAVRAGDPKALRAVLAEGCVWLVPGGRLEGADAVLGHHRAGWAARVPGPLGSPTRRQAHGAHAVLAWGPSVVVVEVRRGVVVFGAEAGG
jgi:ketosteroid isomerase-like protein